MTRKSKKIRVQNSSKFEEDEAARIDSDSYEDKDKAAPSTFIIAQDETEKRQGSQEPDNGNAASSNGEEPENAPVDAVETGESEKGSDVRDNEAHEADSPGEDNKNGIVVVPLAVLVEEKEKGKEKDSSVQDIEKIEEQENKSESNKEGYNVPSSEEVASTGNDNEEEGHDSRKPANDQFANETEAKSEKASVAEANTGICCRSQHSSG
jgi:hypothetical protein